MSDFRDSYCSKHSFDEEEVLEMREAGCTWRKIAGKTSNGECTTQRCGMKILEEVEG